MGNDIEFILLANMIIPVCGEGIDLEEEASIGEVAMMFTKFAKGIENISSGGHNVWNINLALVGGNGLSFGV